MLPTHNRSTLFPYTTLFRSWRAGDNRDQIAPANQLLLQQPLFGDRGQRINVTHPGDVPREHAPVQTYAAPHKFVLDRKSTRLNSSHANISYAVFCLKKKANS